MEEAHLKELNVNARFMKRVLARTRKALKDQQVVIPYDNGGGQIGIRANPAFGEYERLLKSYCSTLRAIDEAEGSKKGAREVSRLGRIKGGVEVIRCGTGRSSKAASG